MMTLGLRVVPSGDPLPDALSGDIPVIAGQTVSLVAPQAPAGFQFVFWAASSTVLTQVSATIPVPAEGNDFAATAWYLPIAPAAEGEVKAWAFALGEGTVLGDSPFGVVGPLGAQTGPNTVSTTASGEAVIVTAARAVVGYGLFQRWLQCSGAGTVAGQVLTVPAGEASVSIAFFALPDPDPCKEIRFRLDMLERGDFVSNRLFNEYRRNLEMQLKACAEENGELPW